MSEEFVVEPRRVCENTYRKDERRVQEQFDVDFALIVEEQA